MYRYSVDNAVTYTPDDFVLFRESPFAVWMERLTLENPDHGIPPDMYSKPPENSAERQGDIVDTLRAEGRDITLVEWELDEPERRRRTLAAMRDGADFIVDGQLALGALSGTANLLMRTSGYSELGDFLYIPCDTQDKTTLQSAFRLCFLADLLHSLQGQLPPQMLVIRGDADVVPLQAEDHIYYFRAVKQRFMEDMRAFRKHQMPDPAQSSHFGRWAECASEVLKQRASSAEARSEFELQGEEADSDNQDFDQPQEDLLVAPLQVAGAEAVAVTAIDSQVQLSQAAAAGAVEISADLAAGQTLAEQARMLEPGSVAIATPPGPTPNLAAATPVASATVVDSAQRQDEALVDLDEVAAPESALRSVPDPEPQPESEAEELAPVLSMGEECLIPEDLARADADNGVLHDLAFIGSNTTSHDLSSGLMAEDEPPAPGLPEVAVALDVTQSDIAEPDTSTPDTATPDTATPDTATPDTATPTLEFDRQKPAPSLAPLPDLEPPEPFLLPPEDVVVAASSSEPRRPHPLDSSGTSVNGDVASLVDLDSAPPPSLAPLAEVGGHPSYASDGDSGSSAAGAVPITHGADPDEVELPRRRFSDSLITSEEFDER